VFQIIAYASRAFALYYALQGTVAATLAWNRRAKGRAVAFACLAVLGFLMAALGVAVEGA